MIINRPIYKNMNGSCSWWAGGTLHGSLCHHRMNVCWWVNVDLCCEWSLRRQTTYHFAIYIYLPPVLYFCLITTLCSWSSLGTKTTLLWFGKITVRLAIACLICLAQKHLEIFPGVLKWTPSLVATQKVGDGPVQKTAWNLPTESNCSCPLVSLVACYNTRTILSMTWC